MKDYDYYLFDFDGTLCDSRESLFPVFKHGFDAINQEVSKEQAAEYMHHSLQWVVEERKIEGEDVMVFVRTIIDALNWDDSISLIKFFPDCEKVLKELRKRGKKIGIVTGNNEPHVHLVLEKFNLSKYFDIVVGAESYVNPKPNGEPCLVGCKKFGVEPSDKVVYVGDSLQDVASGKEAGVDYILLDREGLHEKEESKRIISLEELISICD